MGEEEEEGFYFYSFCFSGSVNPLFPPHLLTHLLLPVYLVESGVFKGSVVRLLVTTTAGLCDGNRTSLRTFTAPCKHHVCLR